MEGLKGSKEALSTYLIKLPLPSTSINYTINDLRDEIQRLNEFKGSQIATIPTIEFKAADVELDPIFKDVITGNKDSRVAKLINQLQNSDWVKTGMAFDTNGVCPFCQRPYSEDIISLLKEYFNEDYERALAYIEAKGVAYSSAIKEIVTIDFSHIEIVKHLVQPYEEALKAYFEVLNSNISKIRDKYRHPSSIIELDNSSLKLNVVNGIITQANTLIEDFNKRLSKISQELSLVKTKFWNLLRVEYSQSIVDFIEQQTTVEQKIKKKLWLPKKNIEKKWEPLVCS